MAVVLYRQYEMKEAHRKRSFIPRYKRVLLVISKIMANNMEFLKHKNGCIFLIFWKDGQLYEVSQIRDQWDSRSRSRPFSWSQSLKYTFSWSRSRSRSRKYTISWSRSRIFVNKSLGLTCWDCTCSSVLVSVSKLKNWSRKSQNPFVGKSTILRYGFGPKSSRLVQIVYRSYRKISESLGLDHFPGLGLSLENTYFPGLGLSLEYLWTRVSVSLVETVSLQSRSRLLRLYLLSLGLGLEP